MLFMSCKCVNVNNLAMTGHGRGLGGSLTGERDLIGHFYQVITLHKGWGGKNMFLIKL